MGSKASGKESKYIEEVSYIRTEKIFWDAK